MPRDDSGSPILLFSRWREIFLRIKQSGWNVDHCHPSSPELMNGWTYILYLHSNVYRLSLHKNNFTLNFLLVNYLHNSCCPINCCTALVPEFSRFHRIQALYMLWMLGPYWLIILLSCHMGHSMWVTAHNFVVILSPCHPQITVLLSSVPLEGPITRQ